MPVTYEILDAPFAVAARYEGAVTVAEVGAMFSRYMQDPKHDLRRAHIVEAEGLDALDIGFSEVFAIFQLFEPIYKSQGQTMYTAIVLNDDVLFGIARIFQNLSEASDWAVAEIFETRREAEAWLSKVMP